MMFFEVFYLCCFFNFLTAHERNVLDENPEETYKKLFKPRYLTSLEEGDVAGARKFLEDPNIDYVPLLHPATQSKLAQILDEEKLTEEAYRNYRYDNLEMAKKIERNMENALKNHDDRLKNIRSEIDRIESHQKSLSRPLIDSLQYYFPSLATKVDPLVGSRSVEELRAEQAEVEKDMNKRISFVEQHPRYFLKKRYYCEDQFGLKRALQIMRLGNKNNEVKEGDGQTVLILDNFGEQMPDRIRNKCVNFDELKGLVPESLQPYHGIYVASVVVDSEIGVARNAKFRAASRFSIIPKPTLIGSDNSLLGCHKNILDFPGDTIEPYHLRIIDEFLQMDSPLFAVKDSTGALYCIETTKIEIPEEHVINLSFGFFDRLGLKRNMHRLNMIHQFIAFATMILKYARAGKVIIWSSGNDSVYIGNSQSFTLVRALSQYMPESLIIAVGLDEDKSTMYFDSNQPGTHPVQQCSLCGPGDNVPVIDENNVESRKSGTSFTAPFISGAIALIMSNFPETSAREVREALLYMASPVVMQWSVSRNGEFPLIIRSAQGGNLVANQYYKYYGKDGNEKSIFITSEMISRGREKYGVGIINISGAVNYLNLKSAEANFFKKFVTRSPEPDSEA